MRTIITSGVKYTDIDALSCAVAFCDLLSHMGQKAHVLLPGPINFSVPPSLNYLQRMKTNIVPNSHDQYVLVDISDPKYFPSFVNLARIVGIFDHHYGFREYWLKRIGSAAKIEEVGAAATLIVEQFSEKNALSYLSVNSSRLLASAIVSNTLDMKLSLVKEKDIYALSMLEKNFPFEKNWRKNYLDEVQFHIEANLELALSLDTKVHKIPGFNPCVKIAQIELYNANELCSTRRDLLNDLLIKLKPETIHSLLILPSIMESKTYFLCNDVLLCSLLEKKYNFVFRKGIGVVDQLILRKMLYRDIFIPLRRIAI